MPSSPNNFILLKLFPVLDINSPAVKLPVVVIDISEASFPPVTALSAILAVVIALAAISPTSINAFPAIKSAKLRAFDIESYYLFLP